MPRAHFRLTSLLCKTVREREGRTLRLELQGSLASSVLIACSISEEKG